MTTPFSIRFLFCSIALSFLIIGILLIKKLFKNHISDKFQYYIWFIFLFMLAIPFLPIQSFPAGHFYDWLALLGQGETITTDLPTLRSTSLNIAQSTDWLQDFSVSVTPASLSLINIIILSVWLMGITVMLILTYCSHRKIGNLKKVANPNPNIEMTHLFEHCKKDIGIRKPIRLYTSSRVTTPITFGFFRPCVIIPDTITSHFTAKDIRYIFLHELQHYKRRDIFINYVMCFFRIIYWFHPLVWYALKEMRTDREIACDISVLKMLDEDSCIEYGNTLINFADKYLRSFTLSAGSEMGGSKKQIKKRIIKIASFGAQTKWATIKSVAIFAFTLMIVLASTPVLSVSAYENQKFDFANNMAEYEDLSTYFDNYQGSFVLYDLHADKYSLFNLGQSQQRISPDSTYKIYSALFALEEGTITKEHSSLTWNGTDYPFDTWNQDQDLSSAMKNSTSWYFQALDKKMGITTLQSYYRQIGYGNLDFTGGLSDYWHESSLKISPVEQVKLLTDFYTNTFGFKEETIQTVKDVLFLSKTNNASLYGKTGTGNVNGKNINGWFIGYVEENDNTYFFATNIQNEDSCSGSMAAKITLSILKDKNIYAPN